MNGVFIFALIIAVVGLAVAGRFLFLAWSDFRFRRERRLGQERRRRQMAVPMERRTAERRN